MTKIVCECCGQPIRAKRAAAKPAAKSFVGYDDFVVAYNAARHACAAEIGARWHLVPGASQWARVPAAWVRCPVYGRVSSAPRDMRLPAARFWPTGQMPIGPEYAAPDSASEGLGLAAAKAKLVADHAKIIATMRDPQLRWGWEYVGAQQSRGRGASYLLAQAATVRRHAAQIARLMRAA